MKFLQYLCLMFRILLLFLRRLWLPLLVFAGIQATGRSELAGCSFLDDPAACERGKTGTQFNQVVLDFYLLRRVCLPDLGSGTGGGYNLQPAGNRGLENYGE